MIIEITNKDMLWLSILWCICCFIYGFVYTMVKDVYNFVKLKLKKEKIIKELKEKFQQIDMPQKYKKLINKNSRELI